MKKIRVSICILFLLMLPLALLTLSGCAEQNQPEPSTPSTDSPPIASVPTKPSLVVSSTENMRVEKRVLIWESVEHAVKYVVNIDGVEYETTECQFDLHKLTVGGGMFDIDVVAFDDQNTRLDSPGMHITVPFDAPLPSGTDHLGFAYTFCADVVGYEVSAGTADLTGTVVIPEYFCDYPVKKLASKALNPYYLPYIMSSKGDLSYNYINNNKAANTETTAVVLPPQLEQIGRSAFIKLLNLTEIVIPDSVTSIDHKAFYNCANLTRVVLPKNLTVISAACFENCPLYEITLPESLIEIQDRAFACNFHFTKHSDSLLTSVIIPTSVQRIGREAFAAQKNLETIILEDSTNIRVMGAGAFDYTAWHQAQPDSGIIYLETILYSCQHIVLEEEVLYITEPITAVAEEAFGGISGRQRNVKKLVITAPLKVIPYDAFTDFEDVIEIILPPELELIYKYAFYSEVLTHVYFSGTQAEYEKVKADSVTEIGGSGRYPLEDNVVYFYSEAEPSEPGNYWHYVDGEATPWFE